MNLDSDLKLLRTSIDTKLESILPKDSPIAEPMLEAMRYAVLGGGKRIRPLLTCTVCSALDGRFEDALLPGCAIELMHAYSLIHDDLPAMDDDDLRHGRPSTHKKFGEAIAILAGIRERLKYSDMPLTDKLKIKGKGEKFRVIPILQIARDAVKNDFLEKAGD